MSSLHLARLAFTAATAFISTSATAEIRDYSGTYKCVCTTRHCEASQEFRITYDRDKLLFEAEGPTWVYTANVVRQVSKTTGDVFLILPAGYSVMGSGHVLRATADGVLNLDGEPLSCSRED